MPKTSEALRALMSEWFSREPFDSDPFDIENAVVAFLHSHGFVQTGKWCWEKPVPAHNMSWDEWLCIRYLIEEWDYGGVINAATPRF